MQALPSISVFASQLVPKKLGPYCMSLLLCFACLSNTLKAEDLTTPPKPGEQTQNSPFNQNAPPALPQTPKPESDDSRNIPQPEVNIIQRKDARIEEYRVNGRLRYVKIIPKKGKPYYLVDKDGDGYLESRHSDLDGIPPINEWIVYQW